MKIKVTNGRWWYEEGEVFETIRYNRDYVDGDLPNPEPAYEVEDENGLSGRYVLARDCERVVALKLSLGAGEKPAEAVMPAEAVNHPSHYTSGKFETIEVIEEITKGYTDPFVGYCVGNTQKYIARAPFKHANPLEDLRKAAKYLEFAIEHLEREESCE